MLQPFEKLATEFVNPIKPPTKRLGAMYIITTMDYFTRCVDVAHVKDCNVETVMQFRFENVVIGFGCLRILMSDQGTHCLSRSIEALTQKFKNYHSKSIPYHP